MNNYCTKCGKKIEKDNLVCKECGTPVVDLPLNYVYKTPNQKKRKKIFIIILLSILSVTLILTIIYGFKVLYFKNKVDNFVEDYFKNNNIHAKYSINYSSSGRCKIGYTEDSECGSDPIYLKRSKCRAYYFEVEEKDGESFPVTLFKQGKKQTIRINSETLYDEEDIDDEYLEEDVDDEYIEENIDSEYLEEKSELE